MVILRILSIYEGYKKILDLYSQIYFCIATENSSSILRRSQKYDKIYIWISLDQIGSINAFDATK